MGSASAGSAAPRRRLYGDFPVSQTCVSPPPTRCPCSFLNEAGLLDLPDSIGSLAALRKLRLNQNALRSLPPSLTALHQLRTLWASGNVFREVPQVVCQLAQLEQLFFSLNPLQTLPPAISQLQVGNNLLGYIWLQGLQRCPQSLAPAATAIGGQLPPHYPPGAALCATAEAGVAGLQRVPAGVSAARDWSPHTPAAPRWVPLPCIPQAAAFAGSTVAEAGPAAGGVASCSRCRWSNSHPPALLPRIRTPTVTCSVVHCPLPPTPPIPPDLHSNKISTLPETVSNLRRLDHLSLHSNDMTLLPPEIGACTALTWLSLVRLCADGYCRASKACSWDKCGIGSAAAPHPACPLLLRDFCCAERQQAAGAAAQHWPPDQHGKSGLHINRGLI